MHCDGFNSTILKITTLIIFFNRFSIFITTKLIAIIILYKENIYNTKKYELFSVPNNRINGLQL